jgi:xanthine/uracil/vitamin C permease (AzgA family)
MSAFSAILEQFFQLEEHNSGVVTEFRAGAVTFLPRLILFLFSQQCCRVLEWILAQ